MTSQSEICAFLAVLKKEGGIYGYAVDDDGTCWICSRPTYKRSIKIDEVAYRQLKAARNHRLGLP
jgi:hypothetical protein